MESKPNIRIPEIVMRLERAVIMFQVQHEKRPTKLLLGAAEQKALEEMKSMAEMFQDFRVNEGGRAEYRGAAIYHVDDQSYLIAAP